MPWQLVEVEGKNVARYRIAGFNLVDEVVEEEKQEGEYDAEQIEKMRERLPWKTNYRSNWGDKKVYTTAMELWRSETMANDNSEQDDEEWEATEEWVLDELDNL